MAMKARHNALRRLSEGVVEAITKYLVTASGKGGPSRAAQDEAVKAAFYAVFRFLPSDPGDKTLAPLLLHLENAIRILRLQEMGVSHKVAVALVGQMTEAALMHVDARRASESVLDLDGFRDLRERGNLNGHWIFRSDDAMASFEGPYVDGEKNGHWVERYPNGDVREGPYVDGKRSGHWVARCPDMSSMEGPYVNGEMNGHWVFRFADGTGAEGSFVDGEVNGRWLIRNLPVA